MKKSLIAALLLLASCAPQPPRDIDPSISRELASAGERRTPAASSLEQSLLPPLRMEMPQVAGRPIDQRFDLSVNNAPAAQVFNSLVAGTRYSMLVPPSMTGTVTVNLKDVTLREALDTLRDVYGYEYRIDGTRIFIQPAGIQTRVFQVNYLSAQRRGVTQVRVTTSTVNQTNSGAVGTAGTTTGGVGGTGTTGGGQPGGGLGAGLFGGPILGDNTRVTTNQEAIFWSDICEALAALTFPPGTQAAPTPASGAQLLQLPDEKQRGICNQRGPGDRSIVVSPHSGVIVVRATPAELRAVDNYLKATRLAVERQVMLEAKIVEVTLSDAYQSGINWAVFNRSVAVGQITRQGNDAPITSTDDIKLAAAQRIFGGPAGAVVGLAVASSNFAALLTFLESQGNVQVLSSPRVATLNNQKAVLKVGDEQLFVSNVAVTPVTNATTGVITSALATPQFTPYFSGIVLDVTPQIDESGNITLHVHPSINDIANVPTNVNLGFGDVSIPTAKSTIRETDTIVRVADGSIVAIGGLMRTQVNDQRGGLPGVSDSGPAGVLFRSVNRSTEKKELVILLKSTIIDSDRVWAEDLREANQRVDQLGREMQQRSGRGAR
jgi:MSHA biogenesis protein MshL